MTASDKLRQLVNKATPGPWVTIDARIGNRAWVQVGPTRNRTVTADVANLADARLIVLAPQLAELVADMAEEILALNVMRPGKSISDALDPRSQELLARLKGLFNDD